MGKQMQEEPQVQETKRSRKWPWIAGGVLILIIGVVLLIPVFLSSSGFTRWVQAKISSSTGGQTKIGNLSVGWLSGVRVANFSFRGPNGWAAVDIDRITAQPSYSRLLGGTLAVDHAEIDQPHITVDLRGKPPSTSSSPTDMNDLSRIRNLVVRNGTVQLTGTTGQTVKIADLNSDVSVRPPGSTSRFKVDMAVAQAQGPAKVQASGQVTPSAKTGWSLRGTTGDVTVEVNALNLDSIAPLLDMAGVQVQAKGQLTGNVTSAIRNGQIENVNANIHGQNIDVTGPALKGDRLQTARLEVRADLAQAGETIDVTQLNVQTDWANISAAGKFPKTATSLAKLTESGAAYNLTGNFDVNLAALLSQMPNTLGVPAGTKVTGGRATGSISTVNEAGRPTLVAKAEVAGLAGVVNGKQLNLSQPMQATARLSNTQQGAQLEGLNVTTPFAQVNASGTFKQIKYDGQVNLQALQSQLGPFINLGRYQLTGQVASTGQVSIGDNTTNLVGSLLARQLVIAADGNNISTPQATADFSLGLNRQQQMLSVNSLTADTGFGVFNVHNATIPTAATSPVPLNLQLLVDKLDLGRLQPYAAFFTSIPRNLTIGGIAQSQVNVASEKGVYHLASTATQIQDFQLISQGKAPFKQDQVTAMFDVYADPNQKAINVARLQVDSPQIHIRKGELRRTSQGNTTSFQAQLDAQWDLAAVSQVASSFLPAPLSLVGQRQVSLNFTSTYPTNDPNAMLANLTGKTMLGFDRAAYMGFDTGPADIAVQVQNGLMQIGPLSSTVNNGKLNFVGQANLRQRPVFLTVPVLVHLVQGVQINAQTTDKLLKYVNPIFADAVSVTGVANFDVQQLAIPLTSGAKAGTQLTGTLSINQLQLGASSILNQVLSIGGQSVRGQTLTVHPTNLVLQNGVVRYEDMQIDVGDNPINFSGSIGLNEALNMTIVLPYTLEGRTVRVSQQVPVNERIAVPLTGTISKPQLNLQKLLQLQLQGQILKGLQDLLQKR
jgi:hypothetical protein